MYFKEIIVLEVSFMLAVEEKRETWFHCPSHFTALSFPRRTHLFAVTTGATHSVFLSRRGVTAAAVT